MRFFDTARESLRELFVAVKYVCVTEWREAPRSILVLIVTSVVMTSLPYVERGLNGLLINNLVKVHGLGRLNAVLISLVVAMVAFFLLRDAIGNWTQYLGKSIWNDRQKRNELRYAAKLASLDTAIHENPVFKNQQQLLEEYGSTRAVTDFFEDVMQNGSHILGLGLSVSIVLIADWRLCLLILAASVPQIYVELRFGKGLHDMYESNSLSRRKYVELRRQVQSPLGVREMHTFQTASHFLGQMGAVFALFLDGQLNEFKKKLRMEFFSGMLVAIAVGISLAVLVLKVVNGTMEIGTFTFVVLSLMGLVDVASQFLVALADQRTDARPIAAFCDLMAIERHILPPVNGTAVRKDRAPRIEFRNVSFGYPASPERLILDDFSLCIESGERMAFVGDNGAGKSTLIKLLFRFYDPTAGQILVDGVDLRDTDLESWYSSLALLAQKYETYNFPVQDLIGLGRLGPERDDCEIRKAAYSAEASTFIEEYPGKYAQQIGLQFGGVEPSGGQEQKLALARALYRRALVTVLDEPTAHVDAGAEQMIFERIESGITPDRTLILISHRFSTVRSADRICVIKDGGVLELGSHQELMALNGAYADLFSSQAEGYL